MKIKIEIKNRNTGSVLFNFEKENNTIKDTVVEAVNRGADLREADLRGADLCWADLREADLRGTDLCWADLRGAIHMLHIPLACPTDGSFIGWKKVGGKLVKLEIPADARRCSATTERCRCDKALVLEITDTDGNNPVSEVCNIARDNFIYKVGEMVYPDNYDECRWNEYSNGIHFFIDKQMAIEYKL